jgi:2-polyprenyl-3-methyl-5-hydroxy-6-metoxy-1,4-benzoquinol methylase
LQFDINSPTLARGSDLDHLAWLKQSGIDSFAGLRILDLGCGSGYLCHYAAASGASLAVGIDVVKPDLPAGGGATGWHFVHLDLNLVTWDEQFTTKFDLILAHDILENMDSPYHFLRSIHRLLAAGGHFALTTPNAMSWERYRRPDSWSGVADPQHKTLFTKYTLSVLLRRAGFRIISLRAPLRRLSFLGSLQPQIGGQTMCVVVPL